jgi:RNA polymerase sigma factor (sigma-70 family)
VLKTTQWTLVFRAAREDRASQRPALGQLIEKYWQPLYFHARRQGMSPQDAEDATQAFLAKILEGDFLESADPARGRFRSYLLTSWKRFLIDRARAEGRIYRGGDRSIVSLSGERGEEAWKKWSSTSSSETDPDRAFDEEWARSLLRNAIEQLRTEYAASHRLPIFDALLPFLTRPADAETYASLSKQLAVSTGAAKVALHRLRQRFAQTLRKLVQETIDDSNELESEIQALLTCVQKGLS